MATEKYSDQWVADLRASDSRGDANSAPYLVDLTPAQRKRVWDIRILVMNLTGDTASGATWNAVQALKAADFGETSFERTLKADYAKQAADREARFADAVATDRARQEARA